MARIDHPTLRSTCLYGGSPGGGTFKCIACHTHKNMVWPFSASVTQFLNGSRGFAGLASESSSDLLDAKVVKVVLTGGSKSHGVVKCIEKYG